MGSSFGTYIDPGSAFKDGTSLKEIQIEHIQDAHDIIGQRPSGRFTPIVLKPATSVASCCCCPCPFIQIPHGFSAIVTAFDSVKDGDVEDGTWSSGCHAITPCTCCFYKVDKLVAKQLIVFDTPVKDCKTKDAITINIDVMLVFEIFEAKTFVYQIGPERFDDLLRAKQDEALRAIANETALEDVYDLHSKNTEDIISNMNEQFAQFGVRVVSFAIQGVTMPPEMAKDLQDRTLFDAKDTMNRMKQEYDRLELNNSEGKMKLQEECSNKQMAADQFAEVTKSKAIKETGMVVATTEKQLAELRSTKEVEVNQMLQEADLTAAEEKAKILAMEREVWATTSAEVGNLDAESNAYVKQKAAEAEITVAEKLANGKRALGEAEGAAAQAFAAKRTQESDMARLNILEQLVANPELQIATSQENSLGMNKENDLVASVTAQGLEALRAKLAEITTTSLKKLDPANRQPTQQSMGARSSQQQPLLGLKR